MKIQCEIIRDLIPLMEDDVCSEQSKAAVLEHIKKCEECRRIYENAKIQPAFVLTTDEKKEKEAVNKGFKKIKRKYRASLIAILLLVPIFYLSWGQFRGIGLSFTNINELRIAQAFVNDLEKGDYEAAFKHLDLGEKKEVWLRDWFNEEKMLNFEDDALRMFCDSAELLKNAGGIQEAEYLTIEDSGVSIIENRTVYRVQYTITVDGHKSNLSIDVTDKGVHSFLGEGSFLKSPVAYFANWDELLWQEYEGCYYDPQKNEYVYYK